MNINITPDERARICDVISFNIDMHIQPAIDIAMEKNQKDKLLDLLETKKKDMEIIRKLYYEVKE